MYIISYLYNITLASFIFCRVIPFDRNFMNHDQEATKYSKIINNTFENMSLVLAIDEIVCIWFLFPFSYLSFTLCFRELIDICNTDTCGC